MRSDSSPEVLFMVPEATVIPDKLVAGLLELYPQNDRHGREHAQAVLKNLSYLLEEEKLPVLESNNAVLAVCLHDIEQRHGKGGQPLRN